VGTLVSLNLVAIHPSIVDLIGVFRVEFLDLQVQSGVTVTLG
jgi:hypothetical protein